MRPVHPGRVLRRELEERTLSPSGLASALRLHPGRIAEIVNEKRGISPDTALRLARFFGNDARFWLNLQTAYELSLARRASGAKIEEEVKPLTDAA